MKDRELEGGGRRLAATEVGGGTPLVVLLHGWSCRRSDWDGTLKALEEDFHLLALDLPGHGDSLDAEPPAWTVTGLATAVADAVRALEAGSVVLAGHSMGGAVALEAASQLDVAKAVLLVDTFVIPYGDLDEEQAAAIEAPFHEDFAAAIEGLVEQNTAAILPQDRKQWIKARMSAADSARMLPVWHDLLRWSPDAAFTTLSARGVPIHALNGDLVPEVARQRCRPHVREWPLDGAGHFPQFEMPERFHATLRRGLESCT